MSCSSATPGWQATGYRRRDGGGPARRIDGRTGEHPSAPRLSAYRRGGRLGSAFCATHGGDYDIVAVYRSTPPSVTSQLQRFVDPLDPDSAIDSNRHPVRAVQADLCTDGAIERVVELALAAFGQVDVLVNAVGHYVAGSTLANAAVLDSGLEQLAVNTMVPARIAAVLAREDWRHHPADNRACNRNVVQVSSYAGVEGYDEGPPVYSAAKAALNALTRHMAIEYAQIGVRVNALAPMAFPRIVTVADVVASIRRLDLGDSTGLVVVLDSAGERML